MIVFRYPSKQILQLMSAVTLILPVVALSSRFIQYLGDAVAGKLASNIAILLILYRLPEFLLVIPLIAVPMSRVHPRPGRYSNLAPAALIYAAYFVLLQFSRDLRLVSRGQR